MTAILVIDASRTIRETLSIVLSGQYQVSTAESASEAAVSAEPALLILGVSSIEDEAPMRTMLATRPAVPVLFLHAADELNPTLLPLTDRRVGFLPKPFDGHALRASVETLLTATSTGDRAFVLEHPFLTREAARIVRQSVHLDLPLLLVGERGTGALAVARAMHGQTRPFRAVPARDVRAADLPGLLENPKGGLFLDAVHELPRETQHALLVELETGTSRARLFGATPEPLDAAVARAELLSELAYPLGLLSVALPPLRERTDDLPALVETVSGVLAARLGLAPVVFSEAAIDRLGHYLWFGNVVELEAVLARTMAVHQARVIGADDLLFRPEQTVPERAPSAPARPRPRPAPAPDFGAPRLEVLLGELAHERRNPMVTIKTFSQHLDSVLADPDVRARFTSLTEDAVARMDSLLEHLLEFARFRAPAWESTELGPLVDEALAEQREELTRRGVRLERNGAVPGPVEADRAQISFALRSLLGGLVRELVPHEPLKLTVPESGAIEFEAHAEPATASRLSAFVDGAETETDETPTLPFALAAALLERNGGSLRVRSGPGGATVIRVTLAPVAT